LSSRALVRLPDGRVKLSEEQRREIDQGRAAAERLEDETKSRFVQALAEANLEVDPEDTWNLFSTKWLEPTVCSLGARTYELITGSYDDWLAASGPEPFLDSFPPELHGALRGVVGRFLDPKDPAVRAYLLGLMDAYFVVEASRLSDKTIESLGALTGHHPSFTLLLDTNVVLSILGLHGDDKKEAAQRLLDLVPRLRGRVQLSAYVLPMTIDETRHAIRGELSRLGELRLSKGVARAVLQGNNLGEIARAFLQVASHADKPISAADYLGPYISDPLGILRGMGVELYNEDTESLARRPEVQADIESQEAFEKRRYGASAKSRTRILHDVVLWYLVNQKRPKVVESPADASYWAVTEDYRLIGFDAHKRPRDSVPLAVQPLALVQLLQFWIGRTDGMEEALVSGLRLSLLNPRFDVDAEKTTIAILGTLSRFQNVDDLPESTVTRILVNDALREKMARTPDEENRIELVREEILAENRRILAEKEQAAREAEAAAKARAAAEAQRDAAHVAGEEAQRRIIALEDRLASAEHALVEKERTIDDFQRQEKAREEQARLRQREIEELTRRVTNTEAREAKRYQDEKVHESRLLYLLKGLVLPLGTMVVLSIVVVWAQARWVRQKSLWLADWRVSIVVTAVLFLAAIWHADRRGRSQNELDEWSVRRAVARVHSWNRWILAAVVAGVIGSVAYDQFVRPLLASWIFHSAH
jgi:hypothetical protein